MASMTAALKVSPYSAVKYFTPSHDGSSQQTGAIFTWGFLKHGPVKSLLKCSSDGSASTNNNHETGSLSTGDTHRRIGTLESLFCYDKPIPEQIIEEPVGVSIAEKVIGDHPRCNLCQAKGAVLCTTCLGSGLYVDSVMESQGIIVKVRCLGCGGSGNIMCTRCGGRGHL